MSNPRGLSREGLELASRWIEDLEGSGAPRSSAHLRDGSGWCVLGRLCEVSGLGRWSEPDDSGVRAYLVPGHAAQTVGLPERLTDLLGCSAFGPVIHGRTVSALSDVFGVPFPELAGMLRSHYFGAPPLDEKWPWILGLPQLERAWHIHLTHLEPRETDVQSAAALATEAALELDRRVVADIASGEMPAWEKRALMWSLVEFQRKPTFENLRRLRRTIDAAKFDNANPCGALI